MTMHCTLEQLVALRDSGAVTEPGHAEARDHLATCEACRAEAAVHRRSHPVLLHPGDACVGGRHCLRDCPVVRND